MNFYLHSAFLYLTTIIINSTAKPYTEPWEIVDLLSVTRFPDIENYYRTIRTFRKMPPEPTWQEENQTNIKKNICKNIFTSHFFQLNQEDWIDTDNEAVCDEIENDYPILFDSLYTKCKNPYLHLLGFGNFFYNNFYKLGVVSAEGRQRTEYVFRCLVRERKSKMINEYFVSKAYNVSSRKVPIIARFIFTYNHKVNTLMVYALAEESTEVIKGPNSVEMYYLNRRTMFDPSVTSNKDPICHLTPGKKLRLCSTIFNSRQGRGKFTFTPDLDNVDMKCQKRKISFKSASARRAAGNKIYLEWMIGCKATSVPEGNSVTYYVSRSHRCNQVYLYSFSNGNVYVKSLNGNASVVKDYNEWLRFQ